MARSEYSAAVDQLYRDVFREIIPQRIPLYYPLLVAVYSLLLAGNLAVLVLRPSVAQIILLGILNGLVNMRLGLLAHDISHGQSGLSPSRSRLLGDYLWNFVLGVSQHWWHEKHQLHHANPNVETVDPDLYRLMTYTEKSALEKRGILGWIARHQAILFPSMVSIFYGYFQGLGAIYLYGPKGRELGRERVLLAAHFLLLGGFLLALLPLVHIFIFMGMSYWITALYMGLTFAPNHIGKPITSVELNRSGVREQLLVTRNVLSSTWNDWLYGGLNYQIEHHLFPTMPRYQFRAAAERVKRFCAEQNLPYCVTGTVGAFQEIFAELHAVGASARASRRPIPSKEAPAV